MKRRTLLATVGSATLAGTAGCYGVASLINRGNGDDDQQENEMNSSENATGDAQTNENNRTGNAPTRARRTRRATRAATGKRAKRTAGPRTP